jgi:flagellar protein FliJ
MNSRDHVLRTQQWQLAERQRYLTDLEALAERLRADVDRLREEIDQSGGEVLLGSGRVDPLFIKPLVERRDKLLGSITEIDAQIAEARDAVSSAQQEMKLVEGALTFRSLRFEERMTRRARRSS